MNNDSIFLLKIRLRADERDALMELSRSERRETRNAELTRVNTSRAKSEVSDDEK